ncbi:hypothetical protein ACQFZV_004421, partial [Cronobacter malonaticus]
HNFTPPPRVHPVTRRQSQAVRFVNSLNKLLSYGLYYPISDKADNMRATVEIWRLFDCSSVLPVDILGFSSIKR